VREESQRISCSSSLPVTSKMLRFEYLPTMRQMCGHLPDGGFRDCTLADGAELRHTMIVLLHNHDRAGPFEGFG
jgi:hypothetical protein